MAVAVSSLPTDDPRCIESQTDAIELVIEARPRDLGGFTVGRVLPSPRRRFVGPFVFLDHMGPVEITIDAGMDIRPHPHIGLSTVTYLFSGENVHRDSLGSVQIVRAGDLNIMTAGKGVVHSERIDIAQRERGGMFHGLQIWLGLPEANETDEPRFEHHDQATLPSIAPAAGVSGRVLIGSGFGATSPVVHPSRPTLIALELDVGARFDVPEIADRGVYVIGGRVAIGDVELVRDQLAVVRSNACVVAREASRVMILGGPPLGHRFIDWNFVSSSQESIDRARAGWKAQTFPKIPGDDQEFIPLPESPRRG